MFKEMSEKNPYKYNGDALVVENINDNSKTKSVYIESYGCAMNFSDSEIVASILSKNGYKTSDDLYTADLILVNTCSIREKAELTVRKRLEKFNKVRKTNSNVKVGVLGCMAERLKHKFLEEEKIVDMVVGPDAYKDLPNLLQEIEDGRSAVNVILSKDETYGDITPTRINSNGVSAFISITRGCDNMCTFCVVPFTRGRERSRDPQSIIEELNDLNMKGFKEITLLGQNVDSYLWYGGGLKKDFSKASEIQKASSINFAKLLEMCALTQPKMRIRFSTSNPQDMSLDVIRVMAKYENICNYIHLPVQSGSDSVLKAMNRQHTRAEYLKLIEDIFKIIPDCSISHDMISGFPNESEKDHKDTLSLMELVKYSFGYMFKYSERPGTPAANKELINDEILDERLERTQALLNEQQLEYNKQFIQKTVQVLIDGAGKHEGQVKGKSEFNQSVALQGEKQIIGQIVPVQIKEALTHSLLGERA